MDVLMKLQSWWDTDRRATDLGLASWTQHLSVGDRHRRRRATGPPPVMVDERSGNLLAGLLMFGLWTAMKRNCAGWREQNRWVSVYSDELAVQAATSAEPIAWMRDQGRSYGMRMRLATQRAEQLPQAVRDVFLTFPNLISYRQESVLAAKSVAENVSQGEHDFTADDIRNLPPFTAVARLDVNRRLVPSFVLAVHNFEADPQASIELLGYRPATVTSAPVVTDRAQESGRTARHPPPSNGHAAARRRPPGHRVRRRRRDRPVSTPPATVQPRGGSRPGVGRACHPPTISRPRRGRPPGSGPAARTWR